MSYDWKADEFAEKGFSDERQIGFIAQELVEVVPEGVHQDEEGYYSVDCGKLTPVLVEAVTEMAEENAELRRENGAEIDQLRTRVEKLETLAGKLAELETTVTMMAK